MAAFLGAALVFFPGEWCRCFFWVGLEEFGGECDIAEMARRSFWVGLEEFGGECDIAGDGSGGGGLLPLLLPPLLELNCIFFFSRYRS